MKIKVGKYTLRSDKYCMWIDEEIIMENGKPRCERVAGYSTTFKSLLSSFRRNKVLRTDAESVDDLLDALKTLIADIDMLDRTAIEQDFKLIERKAADYDL